MRLPGYPAKCRAGKVVIPRGQFRSSETTAGGCADAEGEWVAQWDRQVDVRGFHELRIGPRLAPFAVRSPGPLFLTGQLVLVALGAYWIAILGLLYSPHKHDRPVHCVHYQCVAFLSPILFPM